MAWSSARELAASLELARPFVMPPVSEDALVDLANVVQLVLDLRIPGDFVECGVWRGGSAFLMADLLRRAGAQDRKIWLCDSFQGMPPVESIDGPAAIAEAADPDSPLHVDNSRVAMDDVLQTANALGLASYFEFVPGWFDQTLPTERERIGQIALLRIDCDWYSSVRACLDNLYDQVVDGGFVVLDDYFAYEGCAIAVHEFLGRRRLSHRIESVVGDWGGCEYPFSARFRKGPMNPKWEAQVQAASQELAAVIPSEEAFVLIDEQQLADKITHGRTALPLVERDGEYWGRPVDDAQAIAQVERLRAAGVSTIVFAWPAFWWLESYTGLNTYLRTHFTTVLNNERLLVFALRPNA